MSASIDTTHEPTQDSNVKAEKEFQVILKEPQSYLKIATILLLSATCVLVEGYHFSLGTYRSSLSFQHFLAVCGPAGVAVVAALLLHRFLEGRKSFMLEYTLLITWGTLCIVAAFCTLFSTAYTPRLQVADVAKYTTGACFFVAGCLMLVDATLFSQLVDDKASTNRF